MEAILLSFVKGLGSELGSQTAPYIKMMFWLGDERRKLMNTLSTIEAALMDLGNLEEMSHTDSDWFEKLHDILYDADDLVDGFAANALQKQLLSTPTKKVLHFFSTVQFYVVSAYRLKDMRERLDDMAADRNKFRSMGLVVSSQVGNNKRGETHSYVLETDVIGRNGDKKKIIELVMDSSSEDNVLVIPIIGIGGVGKTTLAQLMYQHEEVQKNFELKMWVCVSDNFNLKLIVAKILESATRKPCENNTLDELQTCLREQIDGKRYLLVLDDVWNVDCEKWRKLSELLMGGAKGSKIVITSRMEMVATITSTVPPYVLASLLENMSWSLFSKLAFRSGQELEKPWLVTIGKEIVRKCAGNPLAIRAVGGLLYTKDTEAEWLSFKNNELLEMVQNENVNVQQILKLSYDHLPSHLKPCFAYCSLFPKDYDLDKDTLIQLWMAHGFIRSSNRDQCLEDAGDEIFMDLYRRSFFQDVQRDEYGCIASCRMHDLFHDLAVSVSGFEISLASYNAENVTERSRHVSFSSPIDSSWKVPGHLLNANKLRTFLLPVQSRWLRPSNVCYSKCDTIPKRFRCLRVLDQNNLEIETVPSSIGDLRHLRYLNLSRNAFVLLPESITKLQFLQTLKLSGCAFLRELPRGISKLVSLKHLEIDKCSSLRNMPCGLGQLSSLHTLTDFIASEDGFISGATGGLSELNGLNKLRGALMIRGLQCIRNVNIEGGSYLKGNEYLRSLTLEWRFSVEDHELLMHGEIHQLLMEGLQPHPNLKMLSIHGYTGESFPSWMMVNIRSSLTNLVKIELKSCNRCKNLPPFGQLPSLQVLNLVRLNSVKYIADHYSHCDEDEMTQLSFPSLKELKFVSLHNLEGWWRTATTSIPAEQQQSRQEQQSPTVATPIVASSSFFSSLPLSKWMSPLHDNIGPPPKEWLQCLTSLERLEILFCPRLWTFPEEGLVDLPSLRFLKIHNCENLTFLPRGMQHLESLDIIECWNLDLSDDNENHMQFQDLRSLTHLVIAGAPKLVSLPAGLQHVATLQYLRIDRCYNFQTLPDWIGNITSLQEVILKCPQLTSIPRTLNWESKGKSYFYWRRNK